MKVYAVIDQLKKIWQNVYAPENDTRAMIEKYFHPDYKQCINGVILHRPEYIEHVIAQKNNIIVEYFDYVHHIQNGDDLFALYYPVGKSRDGTEIKGEVISYTRFKDGQILEIHGQVRLIKGEASSVDMDN